MPIVNVTLEDILRARDARAAAQRRLLRTYRLPLVSFTMNIAGPVKSSPLILISGSKTSMPMRRHSPT